MSNLRILVLEDCKHTRRFLSVVLGKRPTELTFAENLNEGRKCLENGDFDVLISDLNLPDGTGVEFATDKRAQEIPFRLLMTAAEEELDTSSADVFTEARLKPVSPQDLLAFLDSAATALAVQV